MIIAILLALGYFAGLLLICFILKWGVIMMGVIMGDKSVISEFDCKNSKSFLREVWDEMTADPQSRNEYLHPRMDWRGRYKDEITTPPTNTHFNPPNEWRGNHKDE